jgi:hypothetical protein
MTIDGPTLPLPESLQKASMDLRFQLPAVVLPFEVERARLSLSLAAPSRRVTISAPADGNLVELHRTESPLDPLHVEITEKRFLHLDAEGGLHLNLSVSEPLRRSTTAKDAKPEEKWSIEFLELQVSGRVGTR